MKNLEMSPFFKTLFNFILARVSIHKIIYALSKRFDEYTHDTKPKWDDEVADVWLELWEKYHDFVPDKIQIKMEESLLQKVEQLRLQNKR